MLALDALGLGGPVRAMAGPLAVDNGLRDRGGAPLLTIDQATVTAHTGAPIAVVRRAWLHRLLTSELEPGVVRTGTAVRALQEKDGLVHLGADTAIEPADAVVVRADARHPGGHRPRRPQIDAPAGHGGPRLDNVLL